MCSLRLMTCLSKRKSPPFSEAQQLPSLREKKNKIREQRLKMLIFFTHYLHQMGWIYQFFLCAHVLKVGNLTRMWKPASNGTWNPNSVTLWDRPLSKQSESNKSRAVSVRVCTAGSPPILQHHTPTSNHTWLYLVLGVHIFLGGKNILTNRT